MSVLNLSDRRGSVSAMSRVSWIVVCSLALTGCVLHSGGALPVAPELLAVERAEASYQRGLTHMAERNFGKALAAFTSSLREYPNQHRAHYRIARCHYFLGNYDLEILEYRKCLALNPHHKNALYHLGSAYTAQDEITQAQGCFRRLLALSPSNSDAQRALIMLEAVAAGPDRAARAH